MARSASARKEKSRIAKRRASAKAEASEHYQARRRDIVQAAAAVFKEQGLAATSIDDVARAAGIDRATLYYYVGNKNELFHEVVVEAAVQNIEMAETIAGSSDAPEDKLRKLIVGVMASYAQFYPHIYVFLRESIEKKSLEPSGIDIVELQRRFDRALMSIVRQGIETGVFRPDIPTNLAAYGIIGMLNWTHRWFDPKGPIGAEDVADAFATLAVDGLRKR